MGLNHTLVFISIDSLRYIKHVDTHMLYEGTKYANGINLDQAKKFRKIFFVGFGVVFLKINKFGVCPTQRP